MGLFWFFWFFCFELDESPLFLIMMYVVIWILIGFSKLERSDGVLGMMCDFELGYDSEYDIASLT